MTAVYSKAASFLFFILLGYLCKRFKVVGPEAAGALAKINLTVSLPCLVIINFSGSSIDFSLAVLILIAIVEGLVLCFVNSLMSRGKSDRKRTAYIIGGTGYNIGSFTTPFVQSFLPPLGTVAVCVYDTGNAVISTGGSAAINSVILKKDGESFQPLQLIKKLFSSPCIDTYFIMFLLSAAGISIPTPVLDLIRPAANANVFIAMFMLGLMFHIEFRKEYLLQIVSILGVRFALGAAFAAAAWFLLPFDLPVRQAMVLVPFSPVTSAAPAFVLLNDGDEGLAGCVNSISIICSLVILSAMIGIMGI